MKIMNMHHGAISRLAINSVLRGGLVMTDAWQERVSGRAEGKLDYIIRDQEQARSDRKQQYERQEKTGRLLRK